MATLKLRGTNVYQRNYEAYLDDRYRIIVNQGGTRSSKTYSIAQVFVTLLYSVSGEVFTVVRKTLPALKYSAMRDFFEIIKQAEVYSEDKHNKTELIYRENDNELEFIAVDQPQKIRGRKRHILWMNEANELSYEDFQQLNFRTTGKIFLDYNPSDEYHWIYEKVLTRPDAILIKSTYRDNPFLEDATIKEIERMKGLDENYWKIYGLGERGTSQTTIYTHWQFCDTLPEGELIYGLDFGYNNPSCLVAVSIKDDDIYTQEKLYESYLTTADLIERIKQLKVGGAYIYADAEDPKAIDELRRAGLNVKPAEKGKGSVKAGIDSIKKRGFYLTKDSVNLLKEVKSYRWRDKVEGKNDPDEPVKLNDHGMDAIRYAVFTHLTRPQPGIYFGD